MLCIMYCQALLFYFIYCCCCRGEELQIYLYIFVEKGEIGNNDVGIKRPAASSTNRGAY